MEFAVFLVFAVLVAALALFISHMQRLAVERRQREFAALASELGWTYFPGGLEEAATGGFFDRLFAAFEESDEQRFLTAFAHFRPFGQGHTPTIENLIAGREGDTDWFLFDFRYRVTSSNGKTTTTTTYDNSVVAIRMPMLLPPMVIEREGFFAKVAGAFGLRDVQFESEEFNKRYRVRCEDDKGAYDLIHPLMIEFLLGAPDRIWQLSGNILLVYDAREVTMEEYRRMAEDIKSFVDLIPKYFVEDRGFKRNWGKPLDGFGLKSPTWDAMQGGRSDG